MSADTTTSTNPLDAYPNNDVRHYFIYTPSQGAAMFFIVYFGLCGIYTIYRVARTRQYWYIWLALMGFMEMGGYVARETLISTPNDTSFVAQLVIVILAPNLLAMCNYTALGKILQYSSYVVSDNNALPYTTTPESKHNLFYRKPWIIPSVFLTSDIVSIVIQGIGGSLLSGATTLSEEQLGRNVMYAGLGIQLLFVTMFFITLTYSWYKLIPQEIHQELRVSMIAITASMILIIGRNSYRIGEFATGSFSRGYLQQHEAWYMVFEASFMASAIAILLIWDLTKLLPIKCLSTPLYTRTKQSNGSNKTEIIKHDTEIPIEDSKTYASN